MIMWKKVDMSQFRIWGRSDHFPDSAHCCSLKEPELQNCENSTNSESDFKTYIKKQAQEVFHMWFQTQHQTCYSHRMCVEERYKRYILKEFEKLNHDGFTVH